MSAHWDIPAGEAHYLTDVFIRVEVKNGGQILRIDTIFTAIG